MGGVGPERKLGGLVWWRPRRVWSGDMRMRPLAAFPGEVRRRVRGVLTDIDDTPTAEGRLTAEAYAALAALQAAGLLVVAAHGTDIDAARDTLVFAGDSPNDAPMRSEERRVGKGCVGTGRYGGSPYLEK